MPPRFLRVFGRLACLFVPRTQSDRRDLEASPSWSTGAFDGRSFNVDRVLTDWERFEFTMLEAGALAEPYEMASRQGLVALYDLVPRGPSTPPAYAEGRLGRPAAESFLEAHGRVARRLEPLEKGPPVQAV